MLRCWSTKVKEQLLKNGFIENEFFMRDRAIEKYNKRYNWPVVSIIEDWNKDRSALNLTIYYQDNSEYPRWKENE